MIKIEKVHAFRGPDGELHDSREECRSAVLKALIQREMGTAFTSSKITQDEVVELMTSRFDVIRRECDQVMASAG